MSVAAVIASQKAEHGVPHAVSCQALGVSRSWFYKWRDRPPTRREQRGVELDAAVARIFATHKGRYGSPRVHADLVDEGWRVSVNTVAASMTRQGLVARPKRRRRGLSRADKRARTFCGSARSGLHRGRAEPEVDRRSHRGPHPGGHAVPGHHRGSVLPAGAGRGHQRPPRRERSRSRRCGWPPRPVVAGGPSPG